MPLPRWLCDPLQRGLDHLLIQYRALQSKCITVHAGEEGRILSIYESISVRFLEELVYIPAWVDVGAGTTFVAMEDIGARLSGLPSCSTV